MWHNITLKLMYFADTEKWRVYTDKGQYHEVPNTSSIGEAVRKLCVSSSKETINILGDKDA